MVTVDQQEQSGWKVDSLDDARFVINVLSRRTVRDGERLEALTRRVERLEASWRVRVWRRFRGR